MYYFYKKNTNEKSKYSLWRAEAELGRWGLCREGILYSFPNLASQVLQLLLFLMVACVGVSLRNEHATGN